MRILVDVPDSQLQDLNRIASVSGQSRAQLIRSALDTYIVERKEPISSFFGLWGREQDIESTQEAIDVLRDEWNR